jgi:hypothetical protein
MKPNIKPVYSIDVTGSSIVKNRYNLNTNSINGSNSGYDDY